MLEQGRSFNNNSLFVLSPDWKDYELVDSGDGKKLERFGEFRLIRPEPEAIWKPCLSKKDWSMADGEYETGSELHGGHWTSQKKIPERWRIGYKDLCCWIQPSASRHVGVFPEQASHWDWMECKIKSAARPVNVLNLFGYTGLASLAAAHAGASVTHLDASSRVLAWAKENQQLSNLEKTPIRWIKDDTLKFVKREARRGSLYDGLILDPPKFGRGPQGEVWDFYKMISELIDDCKSILTKKPLFLVLTAYAIKASSMTLYNAVSEMMTPYHGTTQAGELALRENSAGRILSTAIFARWSAE